MVRVAESTVEQAALAWLESLGWVVKYGPEIAPGTLTAEREDFGQVVLAHRLRDALYRLNPHLPPEALEEAFRKLTRPEGATLVARNRAVHRMLVDGVNVEYKRPMAPSPGPRCGPATSSIRRTTIGSRSISSPSSKTNTIADRISCCS